MQIRKSSVFGFAIALLPLIAACSSAEPVTSLPDPQAPLFLPEEYAFGTETRVADAEALRAAEGFIESQLDRADLKPAVRHWVAPAGADLEALAKRYDEAATEAGWQAMTGMKEQLGAGRSGVAYRQGAQAFALIWIDEVAPSGQRPVTVIRYRGTR